MAAADIQWVYVPGGVCLFGDYQRPRSVGNLWWAATPITPLQAFGHGGPGAGVYPLGDFSFHEATRLAASLGARLPTSLEWEWAATGREVRRYPWGDGDWSEDLANIYASGFGGPSPVGHFPRGATPDGILDMAGNVWEWTSTTAPLGSVFIRGGSYNSSELHVRSKFLNNVPCELRSPGIGVRLVRSA